MSNSNSYKLLYYPNVQVYESISESSCDIIRISKLADRGVVRWDRRENSSTGARRSLAFG